jgi:hypothetical protein
MIRHNKGQAYLDVKRTKDVEVRMNYTVMHTSIRINLNLFYADIVYTERSA